MSAQGDRLSLADRDVYLETFEPEGGEDQEDTGHSYTCHIKTDALIFTVQQIVYASGKPYAIPEPMKSVVESFEAQM